MNAILKNLSGVATKRDIEISQSPLIIMKNFLLEDPEAASAYFTGQRAKDQLANGNVDVDKSIFNLITMSDDDITVDWNTPLCDQESVKTEMAELEANNKEIVFTILVSSIVA